MKAPDAVAYVRVPDGTAAQIQVATVLALTVLCGETEPAEIIAAIVGRGCIPVLDVDFDGSYLIRSATRVYFAPLTSPGGVS